MLLLKSCLCRCSSACYFICVKYWMNTAAAAQCVLLEWGVGPSCLQNFTVGIKGGLINANVSLPKAGPASLQPACSWVRFWCKRELVWLELWCPLSPVWGSLSFGPVLRIVVSQGQTLHLHQSYREQNGGPDTSSCLPLEGLRQSDPALIY